MVLWLALESAKITKHARTAIEQARRNGQGLAISDITLLEIAVLEKKNRVELSASLGTFLSEVEARFVVLPITGRVCVRAVGLPASYPKDPADRVIAATALVEGVPLVTADDDIRRSKAAPSGEDGVEPGALVAGRVPKRVPQQVRKSRRLL